MKVILAYQSKEPLFCALRTVEVPIIGETIQEENGRVWFTNEIWNFLGIGEPVLDIRTPLPDNYCEKRSFQHPWEVYETMWQLYFRDKVRKEVIEG